jgi:phage terminase small subunit
MTSITLSTRRTRFVAEYLIDLNATQAAMRAGYSRHTAKQQGSRLLTNVDVSRAIAQGQLELAERTQANETFIVAELVEIATNGEKTSDRIRALELLGKRIGMWTPQEAANDSIPDTSTLKDWTIAQLVAGIEVMKREQESNEGLIEGISHVVETDG